MAKIPKGIKPKKKKVLKVTPKTKPQLFKGPSYLKSIKTGQGKQFLTKGELQEPNIIQNYLVRYRISQANPAQARRHVKESMDWFSKQIPKDTKSAKSIMSQLKSGLKKKNSPMVGKMYLFSYLDPVHRKTLDLWDIYPLIFPFNWYTSKAGDKIFVGINMHYVPYRVRFKMLLKLLQIKTGKKYKPNDKLKLSWGVIKSLTGTKLAEHCVHAYRFDHVTSPFTEIPANDWEIVTFMPLGKFTSDKSTVTNKKAWAL